MIHLCVHTYVKFWSHILTSLPSYLTGNHNSNHIAKQKLQLYLCSYGLFVSLVTFSSGYRTVFSALNQLTSYRMMKNYVAK